MKRKIVEAASVLLSWLLQPVVLTLVLLVSFGSATDKEHTIPLQLILIFWGTMALIYPFIFLNRKWISTQMRKRKIRKQKIQLFLWKLVLLKPATAAPVEPMETVRTDVPKRNIHLPNDADPMFEVAVAAVVESGMACTSLIQRRCKLSYARSARILDEMERLEIIGPFVGSAPRRVHLTKADLVGIRFVRENQSLVDPEHPAEVLPDYELLNGHQFEEYCAELLRRNGFTAEVTPASGDHGIDVLAEKDGIRYAIQCKKYSGSVPYAAVQQAVVGKKLYNSDIAVVMSNSTFTRQTVEDAGKLNVRLWGKEKLNELISLQSKTS